MTGVEGDQTRPAWIRVAAEIDGIPIWRRPDEPCYVATRDLDQLRFLAAALARFDRMTGPELQAFLNPRTPRRGYRRQSE